MECLRRYAIVLFEDAGHGIRDGDVMRCELGEEFLECFGDPDERVRGSEFECEDGVAKVMPVDDEGSVAEEADQAGDGESGNGRWVLNKHEGTGLAAVA